MLFQPLATGELGAVVERDRASLLLGQLFQPLLDPLANVVSVLGLNLGDDRESGAATDQRDDAAGAGWSQYGVSFEVAQAEAALDDLGTVANASRGTRRGILAAARAFAAPAQAGFPVLAMLIVLDPGVDSSGRNLAPWILWMGAFLSARDRVLPAGV